MSNSITRVVYSVTIFLTTFISAFFWGIILNFLSYVSYSLQFALESRIKNAFCRLSMISLRHKEIKLSGDFQDIVKIANSNVLSVCNHQVDADFLFLFCLLEYFNLSDKISFFLKSSLKKFPLLKTISESVRFLFLDRNWLIDKKNIDNFFRSSKINEYPLSMVLYPEGTTIHHSAVNRSHQYSIEKNYPCLNNVLFPRARGFSYIAKKLFEIDKNAVILDFTFAYQSYSGIISNGYERVDLYFPSMKSIIYGKPTEVHAHVKIYKIREIFPNNIEDEEELVEYFEKWLFDRYMEKEMRLEYFKQHQLFKEENTKFESHHFITEKIGFNEILYISVPVFLNIFMMYIAYSVLPYQAIIVLVIIFVLSIIYMIISATNL